MIEYLKEDEVLEEILEYLSNMSRRLELIQSKINRIDTAILDDEDIRF